MDEKPVSRKLDCLIAEKIIGTAVEWIGGTPTARYIQLNDGSEWDMPVPYFSTRIDDAQRILERMKIEGWDIQLIYTQLMDDWICYFVGKEENVFFRAHDLPYAICMASLRAIGIKFEDTLGIKKDAIYEPDPDHFGKFIEVEPKINAPSDTKETVALWNLLDEARIIMTRNHSSWEEVDKAIDKWCNKHYSLLFKMLRKDSTSDF